MASTDKLHHESNEAPITPQRIPVRFLITGFGPFGGVEENPTTVIAKKIFPYITMMMKQQPSSADLASSVDDCVILETSVEGVESLCDRLQNDFAKDISNNRSPRRILLHLGVDASSKSFKLEACAYNQATFRIPDVRGFQPRDVCIFEEEEYATCLRTSVNVEQIAEIMTNRFPDITTEVSTDPGRYVCNYVYCSTLQQFGNDTKILFLHVPAFAVVPEKQQLEYVAGLLEALAECEATRRHNE
ncbi:MAG: hypothetical protein SGILL_002850 [Bacillariaceae sp.]